MLPSPSEHSVPGRPPSRGRTFDGRNRVLLAVVAALVAMAVTATLLIRVARSVAEARARLHGLTLEIESVSLGLGVVRFRGVTVGAPSIPGFSAELSSVDVSPSLRFSARRVAIHGGVVRLRGAVDEVRRRFSELPRESSEKTRGGSTDRELLVDGIDVVWNAFAADRGARTDPAGELRLWGARLSRADGVERVGADLFRASVPGGEIDVTDGAVEATISGGRRALASLRAADAVVRVDLDGFLGQDGVERGGTASEPAASKPRRAPFGVALDPKRGLELRERLRKLAGTLEGVLPEASPVEFQGVHFVVRRGSEHLNVGPAKIVMRREPAFVEVSVTSSSREGATPLALAVTLPDGDAAVDAEVSGGPLRLSTLGVRDGDFGLFDVGRAEVRVQGKASLGSDGRTVVLSGRADLDALSVNEPKLARDPVAGLSFGVGGDATFATDGSRIDVRELSVNVGKVTLRGRGTLERSEGDAKVGAHLEVPLAACEDLLASTPRALVPLFSGLTLSGTFTLSGDVTFDTRKPADTRVTFSGANGCRVTAVPESLAPDRFKRPFQRTVRGADGRDVLVESGPGSADWVPLFDVSSFVPTAVVVLEDAHFFTHDGFDGKSLEDSIQDDLRAGRFVRGGSTVSMQLAKNLYLAREKTLSRKLQEAVLTLLLEQTLGKEGILELYLNVVEFGPGLYGIGPAARHYFGVTPKELSLAQSLYLISLLPNPKVHHFKRDGTLTDAWAEYLRHLMDIAHKIRRVTDSELADGQKEIVRFGVAAERPPEEPAVEGSESSDVLGMEPREDAPPGP
ncbi:MAG TPA: biosynthetic peptidoglycan transglycosylase [Polyangiaceae bacterium]|nr:biosynthetic peptidoglycan transglycosylase [Polyangiaceae bacterium]